MTSARGGAGHDLCELSEASRVAQRRFSGSDRRRRARRPDPLCAADAMGARKMTAEMRAGSVKPLNYKVLLGSRPAGREALSRQHRSREAATGIAADRARAPSPRMPGAHSACRPGASTRVSQSNSRRTPPGSRIKPGIFPRVQTSPSGEAIRAPAEQPVQRRGVGHGKVVETPH